MDGMNGDENENMLSKMARKAGASMLGTGMANRAAMEALNREYRMYRQQMLAEGEEPLSKEEWMRQRKG